MGLGLLLDEFSLLEGFEVVLIDLLDFGLLDEKEKFLVFVDVGLFGFEDEVVFEYDDFLFHSVTQTDLEHGPYSFLNIILGNTFNSGQVKNLRFRGTLMGIQLPLLGQDSLTNLDIFELDVVEGIETDEFGVEGFVGNVELFLELLGVEGLVGGELFEDLVLLLHGVVVGAIGWELIKLIVCEGYLYFVVICLK